MKLSIEDIDLGFKAMSGAVRGSQEIQQTVGIQGSKASARHNLGGGSVGEIAVHNEFGTEKIPERSFVRSTYDETANKRENELLRSVGDVLKGTSFKLSDLARVSDKLKEDIQKKMRTGSFAPLAQSTIESRRSRGNTSTQPLYDTHQMHDSVTVEDD